MEPALRELYVARVCSGSVRVPAADHRGRERIYLVRRPSRGRAYVAQELYHEVHEQARMDGLLSDEGLYDFLVENGHWDGERQGLLGRLPGEIEDFKVGLIGSRFRSDERATIRLYLAAAKKKYAELMNERHGQDWLSCLGAASIARSRYLLGASLYAGKRPVFPDDSFWDRPSVLLDNVLLAYSRARIDDAAYRELARTDPWRAVWNSRKVEASLFGVAASEHTDEQKSLVNWSLLYDSVYAHPECPGDDVVGDDDLLDGWMIVQRRKREEQAKKQSADDVTSEAVGKHDEVYLVAGSVEDARRIHDLNDPHTKHVVRQRFERLKGGEPVSELEMPDTKQRLRMEATQRLAEMMKQRKG